jgi:membrane associated rhomboid family serine protease
MELQIISRLLPSVVVIAVTLACALHLYRLSSQKAKPSPPITAILIIGVTALITTLQFIFPEVLSEFRRNREALLAGEWWRMVTPLFVQAHGWRQCCFNGVAAVIVCPLAERLYGKRLLALYFIPGVLGEVFGYLWRPNGAGSSLGIAGVVGGLFAFTFLHRQEVPRWALIFALCGVIGAVLLCFTADSHGPPILIGAILASLMTVSWPNPQGRANERQPFSSETNRTSPAAASRRSP